MNISTANKMTTALKISKETQERLHEALYKNLKLLTYIYPANPELESFLKKDMFFKSNASAFQQTVYYLFNILSPEKTKEKITSWPLYDVKYESKFRNEVASFITWINNTFEIANLVNIMPSQFLTPGGYKFTTFMLSLSNFVIYKHLKENPKVSDNIVSPVRFHQNSKITNIILKNLETQSIAVNRQTNEMLDKFQDDYNKALKQSEGLVHEKEEIENDLQKTKNELQTQKKRSTVSNENDTFKDRLESVQTQMFHLEKMKLLSEKLYELLNHFLKDRPILEFDKDEFQVSENVKHLFKSENKLDLNQLFHSLNVLLENDCLEMPNFHVEQLEDWIKCLSELNQKCGDLDQKITNNAKEISEILECFHLLIEK